MVHVTVRNVGGQELQLDAADSDTAVHVKQKIQAEWGFPPVCQELLFKSTVLADAQRLPESGGEVELLLICSLRDIRAGLGSTSVVHRASALKDLATLRGGYAGAVDLALERLEETQPKAAASYLRKPVGNFLRRSCCA